MYFIQWIIICPRLLQLLKYCNYNIYILTVISESIRLVQLLKQNLTYPSRQIQLVPQHLMLPHFRCVSKVCLTCRYNNLWQRLLYLRGRAEKNADCEYNFLIRIKILLSILNKVSRLSKIFDRLICLNLLSLAFQCGPTSIMKFNECWLKAPNISTP